MSPLVSILIPAYNRAALIGDTLESVRKQRYENFECLVVDDGSTDTTPEVVAGYQAQDPRFRLLRRDRLPKGAPVCRNIGLEHAAGDYVVFLDSDDVLAETCLENRMAVVDRHPGFDFWVFPSGVFFKTPGDTPYRWNVLHKDTPDLIRFLLQDMPWHTMGPVWCKQAVAATLRGFDETALCWQDWELHLRALLAGLPYYKVVQHSVDAYYRRGNTSISRQHHAKAHVLFRVGLIGRFFDLVTAENNTKTIRFAFSVLYYRLLVDLADHALEEEMRALLRRLEPERLFSRPEHLALSILAKDLGDPRVQRAKNQAIKLALAIFNPKKFYNRANATFLA